MPLDQAARPTAFADLPNRGPAAHLLDVMDPAAIPRPLGYNVLVLLYVRPERTAGGIILAEQSKREDEYQGVVGLVLALGPEAYGDGSKFPSGAWVQPGDWVAWPRLKATATRFKVQGREGRDGVVFCVLADDSFTAVGIDPERLHT